MLKLYDAFVTDVAEKNNHFLMPLPFATADTVTQTINGDWCLSMRYPVEKAEGHLQVGNLIECFSQLYRIRRIQRKKENGAEWLMVEAPHIAFDLTHLAIENIETNMDETTLHGIDAREALTQLLANTPFSVGEVTVPHHLDYLDVLQTDVLTVIKEQLLPQYGGELFFDNFTLHLLEKGGQERGFSLCEGKNIQAVCVTKDISDLVTRLHIIGYQGADIKPVNQGKDYLDSPYIGQYPFALEGYVTFCDVKAPERLKAMGIKHLQAVHLPKITYEISLIDLRFCEEFAHYRALEQFALGDGARYYDEELQAEIPLRLMCRTFVASTGETLRVTLGNRKNQFQDAFANVQKNRNRMETSFNKKGALRSEKLQGVIDGMKNCLYASGEYAHATPQVGKGILLENNEPSSPSYGAMYLGPGLFALANQKTETNAWDWRAFGNGAGFSAEEITTGTLSAERIDVKNLDMRNNVSFLVSLDAIRAEMVNKGEGIHVSTEEPTPLTEGKLWLDTTQNPPLLKVFTLVEEITGEIYGEWINVQDMSDLLSLLPAMREDLTAIEQTLQAISLKAQSTQSTLTHLENNNATFSNEMVNIQSQLERKATLEELAKMQMEAMKDREDALVTKENLASLMLKSDALHLEFTEHTNTLHQLQTDNKTMKTYLHFDLEGGLTIGKAGSMAVFNATNEEMSVKHGAFQSVRIGSGEGDFWEWVGTPNGMGLKKI